MSDTPQLPSVPGPDDFRALARSSPWLFDALHFTHRAPGEPPVEAWMRRPGKLEVLVGGERHIQSETSGTRSTMFLTTQGAPTPIPLAAVPPQVVEPRRRLDGLVAERPSALEVEYDDPMWQNYRWVAMLDPVELSHGVEVTEVHAHDRLRRPTWTATCRALGGENGGYDPRCSCCALLFGAVSQTLEFVDPAVVRAREPDGGYPSGYRISLDVETGIVVVAEPLDGCRVLTEFSNEIHDVE